MERRCVLAPGAAYSDGTSLSNRFTRNNEMRLMSDGGKGDKARPMQIDRDKFSSNYDNIFGAKGKKKKKKPPYQK